MDYGLAMITHFVQGIAKEWLMPDSIVIWQLPKVNVRIKTIPCSVPDGCNMRGTGNFDHPVPVFRTIIEKQYRCIDVPIYLEGPGIEWIPCTLGAQSRFSSVPLESMYIPDHDTAK